MATILCNNNDIIEKKANQPSRDYGMSSCIHMHMHHVDGITLHVTVYVIGVVYLLLYSNDITNTLILYY